MACFSHAYPLHTLAMRYNIFDLTLILMTSRMFAFHKRGDCYFHRLKAILMFARRIGDSARELWRVGKLSVLVRHVSNEKNRAALARNERASGRSVLHPHKIS